MSGILRSAGAVTLLSLLLRLASIFTQSRMAESLGAEGLGLLQLAMSVQALAVTLAMSGIRYSATRLIAQELGLGRCQRVRRVTRACALYALGFQIDTYYPPEKVQEHYFKNREDGLRAWENVCLLSATFTSGRAYE